MENPLWNITIFMGKLTKNGDFPQLCKRLPEGNSGSPKIHQVWPMKNRTVQPGKVTYRPQWMNVKCSAIDYTEGYIPFISIYIHLYPFISIYHHLSSFISIYHNFSSFIHNIHIFSDSFPQVSSHFCASSPNFQHVQFQWIGLRENLQESPMIKTWENLWFSPIFNGKIWFSVDFPVKPIFGQLPLLPFTNYHQLPPARKKNCSW